MPAAHPRITRPRALHVAVRPIVPGLARRFTLLSALVASVGMTTACSEPSSDACAVGAESCACTPGGSCDAGLSCLSDICVDADDPTTGESAADGSGETSEGEAEGSDDGESSDGGTDSGPPDTSGSSSSGGVDECALNGGERLASGFCFKNCTYDDLSPGSDLLGDCLPIGMVCKRDNMSPDYCSPAAWTSECDADADCGEGALCVTSNGVTGEHRFCNIGGCSSDTECGTLRCVTECPDGYYASLGFCHNGQGWTQDDPFPSVCE